MTRRSDAGWRTDWTIAGARPVRSLVAGRSVGGPEVVVVPGLGALGYLQPAVRACAAATRVHLLDLPGFGHPATADLPARTADLAAAVSEWLAAVPRAPVLLVGHSTGAQAALRAALLRPDLVSGLVLSGAVFAPPARRTVGLLGALASTLAHERPRELAGVLPEYVRAGRRLGTMVREGLRERPEDLVAAVGCPVTVVRGRADALCERGWAASLAAAAPDGEVVELPGAHNTPTTHPAETARAWLSARRRQVDTHL